MNFNQETKFGFLGRATIVAEGASLLRKILLIGLLSLTLEGIAVADEEEVPAPTVIDLSSLIGMERLIEQVADRQVIFVGETHDRYEHHLNQLAVIESQHARYPELAIGLEFFQQPFQPVLDDYVAGKINEAEFIRKTEYFERWSYDYRLYRPIFRYAREHGIPMIALNLEREITDQVKEGGLESLSEEQKARIPQQIDRDDKAYRQRLKKIYDMHPKGENSDFERFLDVQLLWDEGMAERAAAWFREHPEGHMVILAGVGHLIYGSGIPDRLRRRVPVSSAIVINAGAGTDVDPAIGDYLIMTQQQNLPPAGKLGVMLDVDSKPPEVSGFGHASGAEEAGVKKGDVILRIDNRKINSYTDIKLALMDKAVGEYVTIEVQRDALILGPTKHRMDVELR
ncbi:MAG: ChaN family lipoprotein [Chromatiales bacterium]|jgi:uncharacterized iron-regulated protein